MDLNKINSGPVSASFNLPSSIIFPSPIIEVELTPTEQKLYLQLSIEFQKVLDDSPSFQMGAYQWNQILPDRLQHYGLTIETWERISNIGDNSDEIQDQLNEMIEQLEAEIEN